MIDIHFNAHLSNLLPGNRLETKRGSSLLEINVLSQSRGAVGALLAKKNTGRNAGKIQDGSHSVRKGSTPAGKNKPIKSKDRTYSQNQLIEILKYTKN